MSWLIDHIDPLNADPSRDAARAVVVYLERHGETRSVVVQLSEEAGESGIRFDPNQAVQPYLERRDPPRQLIVGAEGVRQVE